MSHDDYVLAGFVVDVAVAEHGVEVVDALLGRAVVVGFEARFYGAQVHGVFYDFVVVLEMKCVWK